MKVKCTVCGVFLDKGEMWRRNGLSSWCSPECRVAQLKDRKAQKAVQPRRKPRHKIRPGLRQTILVRDGYRCRFCGTGSLVEIHHIHYLSEGGPDTVDNLLCLCKQHHELVHSNKRKWQPILRGVQWMYYAERKRVSVAQFERWLRESEMLHHL